MQRFLDLFISINCSTCFRRFLCPSSEAQNCTYSNMYCQTNTADCCYPGWDGTVGWTLEIYSRCTDIWMANLKTSNFIPLRLILQCSILKFHSHNIMNKLCHKKYGSYNSSKIYNTPYTHWLLMQRYMVKYVSSEHSSTVRSARICGLSNKIRLQQSQNELRINYANINNFRKANYKSCLKTDLQITDGASPMVCTAKSLDFCGSKNRHIKHTRFL
jgi:hypothetical protein